MCGPKILSSSIHVWFMSPYRISTFQQQMSHCRFAHSGEQFPRGQAVKSCWHSSVKFGTLNSHTHRAHGLLWAHLYSASTFCCGWASLPSAVGWFRDPQILVILCSKPSNQISWKSPYVSMSICAGKTIPFYPAVFIFVKPSIVWGIVHWVHPGLWRRRRLGSSHGRRPVTDTDSEAEKNGPLGRANYGKLIKWRGTQPEMKDQFDLKKLRCHQEPWKSDLQQRRNTWVKFRLT